MGQIVLAERESFQKYMDPRMSSLDNNHLCYQNAFWCKVKALFLFYLQASVTKKINISALQPKFDQ